MPPDGEKGKEKNQPSSSPSSSSFTRQANRVRNLFSIPVPVKRLFDKVPVLTYAPNELPQRTPRPTKLPTLYVFIKEEDAAAGRPSFNPGCLKWQAFLKIAEIQHRLLSSNNHASPTGALPFLLPSAHPPQSTQEISLPIPSNKLVKFALDHGSKVKEPSSMRYEAYQSLLDHRIRNAWLYNLYLEPTNAAAVAQRLYVDPVSSNTFIRATISHQLRTAAEAELLKYAAVIDVDDLYGEAEKAFEALSILLGGDRWFFGGGDDDDDDDGPTLFDASVFAYTHLLLDERMGWKEKKLVRALRKRENLVEHRERLLVRYFDEQ